MSWSSVNCNDVVVCENRVNSKTGCKTDRYVLSNETLPSFISYIELEKKETGGCYESLGVCTQKNSKVRNGENEHGWALRLFGEHTDL